MIKTPTPSQILKYFIVILVALVVLVPIVFAVMTTFKTNTEYIQNPLGLPHDFNFENYRQIFQKFNFPRLLFNSLFLTLSSVVVGCYVSLMAAYAFGKMQFRGRQLALAVLIPTMSVPAIVMVIPLFSMFSELRLVNKFIAPIIIYIGLIVPFSVYLLTSFMDSIPNEIIEAGMMDGLGSFGIFHRLNETAQTFLRSIDSIWTAHIADHAATSLDEMLDRQCHAFDVIGGNVPAHFVGNGVIDRNDRAELGERGEQFAFRQSRADDDYSVDACFVQIL